jgi:hypothetical protein
MNLSSPVLAFLAIFFLGTGGPIFAVKIWTHYRLKKGRLALKNGEPPATPFEPKPEPAPGIFLRRFNPPQRVYLRRQRRIWLLGYILCSWILFVTFSVSLPPQMADNGGFALSLPQSVWYTCVRVGFGVDVTFCSLSAVLFGGIAVQRKTVAVRFMRTRPVTLRLIFWGRTGLALTNLLAGITTAALGFFLLLLIFYGPVWNHVPSAISAQEITEQQADYVISALQTSPARLVLSLLTTSTLVFSLVVLLRSLPWSPLPNPNSIAGITLFSCLYAVAFSLMWVFLLSPPFARVLFFYNYKDVGPPPSYAYALIAITIAAALLRRAEFFNARNEVP